MPQIQIYYADQYIGGQRDYPCATISRYKDVKDFWKEMDKDKKFIRLDDNDENIKYLNKDRIIEIWIEKDEW
ncbi:hypothetical protein [Peptoanaerobacter stomatis]|uniref:hypothetical protein n=1 Tax=Peptoanaerobacter stomatis TaxID=796937 RepID=UPI003F9F049A